jgi:hypothetical protein
MPPEGVCCQGLLQSLAGGDPLLVSGVGCILGPEGISTDGGVTVQPQFDGTYVPR